MDGILQACGAELVLLATVVVLTLLETLWPRRGGSAKVIVALFGVAVSSLFLAQALGATPAAIAGVWTVDWLAVVFKVVLLVAATLVLFQSVDEVGRRSAAAGEFAILVLLALVGMMVMVSGTDLLVIVLGLELMAISFYILVGFAWFRETSSEGALKYVLTGLFGSGLLLYGISFLYGAAGGTSLERLAEVGRDTPAAALVLAGIALLACGLAFKMGAAPFHMWMPDVLEGAPTPVAGYLAVGPKVAVLAVTVRLFSVGFPKWVGLWVPLWWSLAALTILWGNLAALAQAGVKRMLAYSSIAHVGYLLIAVVASGREPGDAVSAMGFYLLVYAFMNLGAFGVLLWFENATGEEVTWRGLAGLQRRSPTMAFLFSLFMFSLAGIPPTAGFVGKFWVFLAGWKAGYPGLVLIGALGSLIGAFYYLRAVYAIYLLPAGEETPCAPVPAGLVFLASAVFIAAVFTVLVGVAPELFMQLAARAAVY